MHTFIKIITIMVLCLAAKIVQAQYADKFKDDTTFTDTHLTKFAGTWRYINDMDTVTFLIKKGNYPCGVEKTYTNCFYETLVGYHEYKKGNILIESSMALQDYAPGANKYTITSHNFLRINGQHNYLKLNFSFYDISKNDRHFDAYATMNTAHNQITWELKPGENMHRTDVLDGATFPKIMIFNKVQ
jgi:hypothetical protein